MADSYWLKQDKNKPLFPDIEWAKPEQKQLAGNLGIAGGSKAGFRAAIMAYETAMAYGAGDVKLLLPDTLKPLMPPGTTNISLASSTSTGSFSHAAMESFQALLEWANAVLLIGDNGKNSETSLLLANFLKSIDKPAVLARDTIDLLMTDMAFILENRNITLITSLAQLQKIFRTTYYPKMITFNIQLSNLVEILHKFTITYPISLTTYHDGVLIVAANGQVTTTPLKNPMSIWSGEFATRASCQLMWSKSKPLEAITTAVLY